MSGNEAAVAGGAIRVELDAGTLAVLDQSMIQANQARSGPGGAFAIGSDLQKLVVSGGSRLSRNTAAADGGVVSTGGYVRDIMLRDCIVENNTAGQNGGAIGTQYAAGPPSTWQLWHAVVSGNEALLGSGGAVYMSRRVSAVSS